MNNFIKVDRIIHLPEVEQQIYYTGRKNFYVGLLAYFVTYFIGMYVFPLFPGIYPAESWQVKLFIAPVYWIVLYSHYKPAVEVIRHTRDLHALVSFWLTNTHRKYDIENPPPVPLATGAFVLIMWFGGVVIYALAVKLIEILIFS